MSKKKITLIIMSVVMAIIVMTIPNVAKASTKLTTTMCFGVIEFREDTTPKSMGYAISNPYDNGSTPDSIVGAKIWQIVKYGSKASTTFETGNYYCVRAGVGFNDITEKADYTISYNLKTEKSEIEASGNDILKNLVSSKYYNNLLALTDLVYLKGVSSAEERAELLNAAGIRNDRYENLITDSDIEAVQQAAMWYFTNYDDVAFKKVYNQLGKTSWLYYRTSGMGKYVSFSGYDLHQNSFGAQTGAGLERQAQAELLYNYLIKTANTNAAAYANGTAVSNTKVTLYSNATNNTNTQPIILIERTPDTREFDLALRKYITKVNGTNVKASRKPNIDITTIKTSGTATYKHRKDPLTVNTGDVVTYNLTVYNEGDKAGRATKIVDQLPTGLKLKTSGTVTSTKGNNYTVSYDESANRATFTTKDSKNMVAYNQKSLDSDTIEIECTVEAKANTKNDITLTNVAWISEEYDAVTKETITSEKGKDRDSEPSTTPNVNKDNMSDHTGNNNKADLTDSNYYYKGQQDDDDFEKLIIKKQGEGTYNVVLIKQDANGEQLNSKATFVVNGETKDVTGRLVIVNNKVINESNVSKADTYEIKETVAPDSYCKFDGKIVVTVNKKLDGNTYKVDNISYKILDDNNKDITSSKGNSAVVELGADGNLYVKVKDYQFDLALRKYITKVNGKELTEKTSRVPNVDISSLKKGTTATYKHRKDPVAVTTGTIVTYRLTVYNEGQLEGRATKIVDQLPTGLKLKTAGTVTSTKGNSYAVSYDEATNKVTLATSGTKNLSAYNGNTLDSDTIEIECTVIATANTTNAITLTNVAWISEEYNAVNKTTITNQKGSDRDSEPSTVPGVNKDNMSDYKGNNNNKSDLSDSNNYYKGEQDDDDFEKLIINKQNAGSYNLVLVKEDSKGEQLNSKATFTVNNETKDVTGRLTIASNKIINENNVKTPDTYEIIENVAPDGYCKFDGKIVVTINKKLDGNTYKVDSIKYKILNEKNEDITSTKGNSVAVELGADGNLYVKVKNYQFDLKLIKRIVEVNGTKVPERLLGVDVSKLAKGTDTTAEYEMDKDPVSVKNGDIVKYTLRVYNEGEIDGYASEISEDIPEGLEFMWSEKEGEELKNDTTLTQEEKEAIKYNQGIWDMRTINQDTHRVELIATNYLAKGKGAEITKNGANLIKAFDKTKGYVNTVNEKNPDYREVSVYMKVTASNDEVDKIIRNEAAITGDTDKDGNPVDDRDSKPEVWKKYEDDEDYDNVKLQSFDLALRKFIIAVSKDTTIEDSEYLKDENGSYTRAPKVDTSKLNTVGEDGKLITTATYNHPKTPVEVTQNDIVVYMLRVYNEGTLDGYASEIKDHLPSYLKFVEGDFNNKYGWKVSEDGRTVTTSYLDNSLIGKATTDNDGKIILSYKEIPIMCKVTGDAQGKITNIADITKYKDENKKDITDRDSKENNVVLPSDSDLPSYKDDETGDYIPGQEDDDDFEKLVVKKFDLALRKFITNISDTDVTSRIPQVKYDKDNNKITYEHSKDPLDVVTGDVVTYTIRVFNEGEIDGFASKVSDDIPDGLEYLPDNDLNKEYRWVMYDKDGKETTDVKNAVKLTTDYLSKEQGEARMATNSELKENPALLTAFDGTKEISDTNPDYADVKIAFKVTEPNGSSKILVNSAQISDDTDKNGNPVDDIDSTPDKWIDGEDDQDKEYIKLTEFDLALRKWVTQAIVIENGKETVTQTGHKAEDDPEQVVKVELNRKKLNSVTVKFRYSIRVTNEGDIAGYAKQIKDYIPEGLKFDAKDNPDWNDEGNNIITTRKLENTLLQPGQSAEVEVLLTWKNDKNNLGLKVNTAEISEDYNEKHVHDRDSTPDNKVPGEDDIDDAPVLLSISTGAAKLYITLTFAVLVTLASGVVLIKKFVL